MRATFFCKLIVSSVLATGAYGCALKYSASNAPRTPNDFLQSVSNLIRQGNLADEQAFSQTFRFDVASNSSAVERSLTSGEALGTSQSFLIRPKSKEILLGSRNVNPYYQIFRPVSDAFSRVTYMEEVDTKEICLSKSHIFSVFGAGKFSGTPHAPLLDVAYQFQGENSIQLIFQFESSDTICASKVFIYQNRNR